MSQNITPVDGGRKEIQVATQSEIGTVLSPQYRAAKNLFVTPTEWFIGGKPIYNRLPAISERYRIDFGYDDSSAFVYLPAGQSIFGPDSLEVKSSEDGKFITIKGGTTVWKHGEFKVDPVIIDVRNVGFGNTKYLFAYQFFLDDAPYDAIYSVEDYNLRGYPMVTISNTDSVKGWRYLPQYAFYGSSSREWRNYDTAFPEYTQDAELSWTFTKSATFTKMVFRCPPGTTISGSATLAISTDSLSFNDVSTAEVSSDNNGQFFQFDIPANNVATSWRVRWTDKKVAIRDILVTGTLSLKRKPSEGLSRISLVAYPQATLPTTAQNSLGEEVPAVYCKLAYVEIGEDLTVTKITDLRESVNSEYKPIAEWLTRPWDGNLIKMHHQVSNYSTLWMSPTECLKFEYEDLENTLIDVE